VALRFALDEDFPETIIEALGLGISEAELVPIRLIHPRLRQMDDWKLLLSLYHLGEWDGLMTTDTRMLSLPREVSVIHQTRLTVVAVEEAGHDPIRGAGLVLVHLPTICRKSVRTKGQIWRLSAANKNHDDPWEELLKIAKHLSLSPQDLYQTARLSPEEMESNPLEELAG
jgi:hypothetical protein